MSQVNYLLRPWYYFYSIIIIIIIIITIMVKLMADTSQSHLSPFTVPRDLKSDRCPGSCLVESFASVSAR